MSVKSIDSILNTKLITKKSNVSYRTRVESAETVPVCKMIIWKTQGVLQYNDVAHPKHPEEEETSPNRNNIDTGKQKQTN